jgi:hypothetical protein
MRNDFYFLLFLYYDFFLLVIRIKFDYNFDSAHKLKLCEGKYFYVLSVFDHFRKAYALRLAQ